MTNRTGQQTVDLKVLLPDAQLPALPQSAIRLLELSQDPDHGPHEFTIPIEADPGLAVQVLKFVNSSYFGFSKEISSVKLAITMVGIRTIKNFALWSAVFSLMPNPKCGPFDLKSLWQDSLRRGLFAREMGKLLGMKEAEEPFAAALLQDMAVPILATQLPDVYAKLLDKRDGGRVRLSAFERQLFGWSHADAAAMMAEQWNFPDEFVGLIKQHTNIKQLLDQPNSDPGEVAVAMSSLLPANADEGWPECGEFEDLYKRSIPSGTVTVEEMLKRVDDGFAEFAPVLKISNPAKSLAESFAETQELEPAK